MANNTSKAETQDKTAKNVAEYQTIKTRNARV